MRILSQNQKYPPSLEDVLNHIVCSFETTPDISWPPNVFSVIRKPFHISEKYTRIYQINDLYHTILFAFVKYKIEKPDDSEEEEDEEDFGAPSVKEDLEDDSITRKYQFHKSRNNK